MSPGVGFVLFLIVTLAFLGAAVFTGLTARRKRHFLSVAGAVVSLGVTIYYAEALGELYDLEASGWIYPFHLWCAKITVLAYLAPVVTGFLTIANLRWKRSHRTVAFVVLGLTVLTAITGSAMLFLSEPLPSLSDEEWSGGGSAR